MTRNTHRPASKASRLAEHLLAAADRGVPDVGRRRTATGRSGLAPLLWGGAAILLVKVGMALLVLAPLLALRGG